MEKLQIVPLNIEKDVPIIKLWPKIYANHPNFNNIERFILEGNTYYGLDEVILTNYEFFHIGEDERKFCLSIINQEEIPIGFILACLFNIERNNPELILQYIVLSPEYQSLGYGTVILKELLEKPEKYFLVKPNEIYASIEKDNTASLNLFKKFGFSFTKAPYNYLRAHKSIKELQEEKI